MDAKPTLRWSNTSGEGSLGNLDKFRQMDWIYRADALKDWIFELQKEYDRLFFEPCGSLHKYCGACPYCLRSKPEDQ